jgi:hypothetical protein
MYLHFVLIRKTERTTTARNKGYTSGTGFGVGRLGVFWEGRSAGNKLGAYLGWQSNGPVFRSIPK